MSGNEHKTAAELIATKIQKVFENDILNALTTSTAKEKPVKFDTKRTLEEMRKAALRARRSAVTFQVDVAHEGPMLKRETPNDGIIIELSWQQLLQVHNKWPVKLHRVASVTQADFVPASHFDKFIPMAPPAPPWEPVQQGTSEW